MKGFISLHFLLTFSLFSSTLLALMPFLLTYYSFCSKFKTPIQLEVGKLIAKLACSNCHALEKGAAYKPFARSLPCARCSNNRNHSHRFIVAGVRNYIPPIKLAEHETKVLAAWLTTQN
ncbi:hypothetical protein [Sulfurospirillum arsenophilum]|uniref:hypothetical protein n=1 Tax=Sulfurospirillum arsenophilum TaxID=56698 RepID=UPI0012EB3153|nr:hypothetical protein [Sulfurospirillum arsenophilum]